MAKLKIAIFDQRWELTVSNSQEALIKTALAIKYRYEVNVVNPSFNPQLPVGGGNSQYIANPVSKEDFIAKSILAEILSGAKALRIEEKQRTKTNEATVEVDTEFNAITITEEGGL